MRVLSKTEFGNPILRKKSRKLTIKEIKSASIQSLINDMRNTLITKKLGVGLAAPQVGKSISLAVIAIHPTAHRPKVKDFELVIINPVILSKNNIKPIWEGCLSSGKEPLFAKVPRYSKITASFLDENGKKHNKQFTGLQAQVIQHETDHLLGILYVDKVEDPTTFMTLGEYKKRIVAKRKQAELL